MQSVMGPYLEVAAVAGLFLLRLGVPLAITTAVVWWLRRLDAHWQAEAEAESRRALEMKATAPGPAEAVRPARPCWEERNCPESVREHCPAYFQPAVPCWLARRAADGYLPTACADCARFTPAPAPVAVRQ